MGKPIPKIFQQAKAPPVVMPVPVCTLGQRCHVNGKGLTTFGTKFPLAMVQKLASCSIQLCTQSTNSGGPDQRVASGVLIAPEVALFAGHSVLSGLASIRVLMDFECSTTTAPPGMRFQYPSGWPSCTPLATAFQAVDVKLLESSDSNEFDYALVLIKWNTVSSSNTVSLPRVPVIPKPSFNFSTEMLLIGHPDDSSKQGEQTQGCAFKVVKVRGPNPQTGKDDCFGYGEFGFLNAEGFSGGGVFNDSGGLVGILKGTSGGTLPGLRPQDFAFLNLGLCAGKTSNDPRRGRLIQWMNGGSPLKPGDGGSATPPTFV